MRTSPSVRAATRQKRRPAATSLPSRAATWPLAMDGAELVAIIERLHAGVRPAEVNDLAKRLGMSRQALLSMLDISRSSFYRKARHHRPLSHCEGSRVIGLRRLIEQVKAMVDVSGDPRGFDAARWLADWMQEPLPALGGRLPAQYMDCFEGQQLISILVARIQTAAYS